MIKEFFSSIKNSLNEELPASLKDFFYALGGTPFFLFFLQVVTGILLLFYYVPSSQEAYESVYRITYEIPLGWWIRGLHKYGASLFIISIFLHLVRTFVTKAYLHPRELTWVLGSILLYISLAMGFTGYSLLYDQLSYWATTVGTNIARATPFVGEFITRLIKGGETLGQYTLSRSFVLHIFVLPILMTFIIFFHIILVRRHGISLQSDEKYPFIPDHLYIEIMIFLFLLSFLSLLSVIFPPGLGEKANPYLTPSHIKPEWYFYPLYLLLKLFPLKIGISITLLLLILFSFYPFVEKYTEKIGGSLSKKILRACGIFLVLYICFAIIKESIY